LFDIFSPITDLFGTIAQWVGYGIIFFAVTSALFFLVAVPIAIKWAAVAVAKTVIVETSNLLARSGIITQTSNALHAVEVAANRVTQNASKQKYEVIKVENVEVE
jgi:hypothetical protein